MGFYLSQKTKFLIPISDRYAMVDRSVDRGQDTESKSICPVDRPVDRGISREQSSLDDRPARSIGLLPGQGVHVRAHRSTDRSTGRPTLELGRPVGRPLKPEN